MPAARIPLSIAVRTHTAQKLSLAWRDSASKMMFIEIKAFVDLYSVVNDDADFDVFKYFIAEINRLKRVS